MVTARPATSADIPALVQLMHEFYTESSFPLDRGWAISALARLLAEPAYGGIWLIERDDAPVGHVVLTVRYAMEYGGLCGYIDDLFVQPPHRRHGGARAGLDALFSECRRRGCLAVVVEVGADNLTAQAVYRRYGLAPLGDGRQTLRVMLNDEA